MYSFRGTHGPVELAFTDRYGGVSRPPFDALNLALSGGDDPEATRRNLALVLGDFAPGAALADMRQVHGAEVVLAGTPRIGEDPPACDGIVTERAGVVLMVRMADCVPVLLADAESGVIGAAHAGRRGVAAGVVGATVARMRDRGARDLRAWVGPHVCGRCYEVSASVQEEVAALEPAARATTSRGTPALDLGAAVRDQLERAGVRVDDASRCTQESVDLYSYRRDHDVAGRLAGLIVRRG